MSITEVFFWISLSVLFFCYVGYGLLLFLLNSIKRFLLPARKKKAGNELLPVTIIVAAYNEQETLERKVKNILSIDYPGGLLHTIFITDGSTDDSQIIIPRHPSFLLLHQDERKGKTAAIKRAMQHVNTPVVVFSDANTELNSDCIRKIVAHYDNPGTGGVAGEKKISSGRTVSAVGRAEGIYWRYESFMKKQDADFNTVVGAAGELFSIRTGLFSWPDDHLILDDFVISMNVCLQGYKIEYEPRAFATEFPSASLAEEEKRKVRISAGAYQCIGHLRSALNIFKHPLLTLQYICRRLLRWIVCPPMLIVLMATNILLILHAETPFFYLLFLYSQVLFYAAAFAGWLLIYSGKKPGILTIPFYFIFMNYCLVKGFGRFIQKKQTVLWERSVREATG